MILKSLISTTIMDIAIDKLFSNLSKGIVPKDNIQVGQFYSKIIEATTGDVFTYYKCQIFSIENSYFGDIKFKLITITFKYKTSADLSKDYGDIEHIRENIDDRWERLIIYEDNRYAESELEFIK